MESLKELDDFLLKRGGASYSELKSVFTDEVSLKKFIKLGLENERIIKDGEKRGTKYYSAKGDKSTQTQNEDYKDYEPSGNADAYLNLDKPLSGVATIINEKTFGPGGTLNVKKFLESGKTIETLEIGYSKAEKRNVILDKSELHRFNTLGFRKVDGEFVLAKYDHFSGTVKQETFPDYEEFREAIRSFVGC